MKRFFAGLAVVVVLAGVGLANLVGVNGFVSSALLKKPKAVTTKKITEADLFDIQRQCSGETVFVKFYADWCEPCRATKPSFDRLSSEVAASFYEMDVDTLRNSKNELIRSVQFIPTIVALRNGKEIDRVVGGQTYEQLKKFVDKNK